MEDRCYHTVVWQRCSLFVLVGPTHFYACGNVCNLHDSILGTITGNRFVDITPRAVVIKEKWSRVQFFSEKNSSPFKKKLSSYQNFILTKINRSLFE